MNRIFKLLVMMIVVVGGMIYAKVDVAAQVCSGAAQCGTWGEGRFVCSGNQVQLCNPNENYCQNNGWGSCQWIDASCNPNGASISCSPYSGNPGACASAHDNCASCAISSCTWIPGGGGGSPTPGPTGGGGGPGPTAEPGCVDCGTQCAEGTGNGSGVDVSWENTGICNCGHSCAGWQGTDATPGCQAGETCIRVCWSSACSGGNPTNTPMPTPTSPPPVTTSGQLTCRYGGVYPNKYSNVTDYRAWVGNATGSYTNVVNVTTNSSGNGFGVFSIPNWTLPGYPGQNAFYLRAGIASSMYGGNGALTSGKPTSLPKAGCDSAFESCEYSTIIGTSVGGFDFDVTDVNPNTMMVTSCGANGVPPHTFRWAHAPGNPSRYLIRANYVRQQGGGGNNGWYDPNFDISCFRSAAELGCGDGICEFTPPATVGPGNASPCDYTANGIYDWWSVQPKTDSSVEYFCEQVKTFSCGAPTPTPAPGMYSIQTYLYQGSSTMVGGLCTGTGAYPSAWDYVLTSDTADPGTLEIQVNQSGNYAPVSILPQTIWGGLEVYRAIALNLPTGTHNLRYTPAENMGVRCPGIQTTPITFPVTISSASVTVPIFVGWDVSGAAGIATGMACDVSGSYIGGQVAATGQTPVTPNPSYKFENLSALQDYTLTYTPVSTDYEPYCPSPSLSYTLNNLRKPQQNVNFGVTEPATVDLTVNVLEKENCGAVLTTPVSDPTFSTQISVTGLGYSEGVVVNYPNLSHVFTGLNEAQIYNVALSGFPLEYEACDSPKPISPLTQVGPVNMHVTRVDNQWWEVVGGDALANGSANPTLESLLPINGIWSKRLNSVTNSAGLLMTPGIIDKGPATGAMYRDDLDWQVKSGYTTNWDKENYDYFSMKFAPKIELSDLSAKPACGPDMTCAYEVSDSSGGAVVWDPGTWTGASWEVNEKIIIFVNDEDGLSIVNNNLTLPINLNGAYLAIISRGDIVISTPDTISRLEGVYITDGDIKLGQSLVPFTGKGVFVGWSDDGDTDPGIVLERENPYYINPAERFEYWPELVLNTPRKMMATRQFIREAVPRDIMPVTVTVGPPPTNTPVPTMLPGISPSATPNPTGAGIPTATPTSNIPVITLTPRGGGGGGGGVNPPGGGRN